MESTDDGTGAPAAVYAVAKSHYEGVDGRLLRYADVPFSIDGESAAEIHAKNLKKLVDDSIYA